MGRWQCRSGAERCRCVAVAVLVAVRGGADVVVARDEPSVQVVAGDGGALCVLLASQPEDLAGEVEGLRIDERRVRGGVVGVAKVDLAAVDPVAQHGADGHVVPWLPGLGAVAALVEPGGDGLGAVSLAAVAVEDDGHERRFVGVHGEVPAVWVDEMAVGAGAAAPLTAGGFAFHAGNHPVDDGGPLELDEHAVHLDHHPPGRGGGVERLGGRTERHSGGVELFEQRGQAPHRPGEAVDTVDEQEVEAMGAGLGEGSFEVGAFGGGARRLVAEGSDQLPVLLAVDVGAQSGGLGSREYGWWASSVEIPV